MRLMLGTPGNPVLLVRVENDYESTYFKFTVINGAWHGLFTDGYITIYGAPSGDFSSLDKMEILTANQDRLRGEDAWDYQTVFNNFHDPNYVGGWEPVTKFNFEDDDIPF